MIYSPGHLGSTATMPSKHDYQRIYDGIKAQIDSGVLPPGAKLPTKRELAQEYGVSTQPVERALLMLQMDGLVEGRQGKGNFVRRPGA